MAKMPSRDITGKCKGECRDRVHESEVKQQREINAIAKRAGRSSSRPSRRS